MSPELVNEKPRIDPNYEPKSDDVKLLTRKLLDSRMPAEIPDGARFVTIEVGKDSEFSNIGRYIEGSVFLGSFGNTPEMLEEAYVKYEDASRFFLSIDAQEGVPTGVLRVIENSQSGLMTLNDVQEPPFNISLAAVAAKHGIVDFDKVWDVGTVAVLPEFRHGQGPASIQLFRAMYLSAVDHKIEHLVSMIDDKLYKKLNGILGIPFKPLADAKPGPYMDSQKTHPVHGFVPEFYEKMSDHRRSSRGKLLARFAIGDSLDRLVEGSQDSLIFLDK
jgi:hypothetical protein